MRDTPIVITPMERAIGLLSFGQLTHCNREWREVSQFLIKLPVLLISVLVQCIQRSSIDRKKLWSNATDYSTAIVEWLFYSREILFHGQKIREKLSPTLYPIPRDIGSCYIDVRL